MDLVSQGASYIYLVIDGLIPCVCTQVLETGTSNIPSLLILYIYAPTTVLSVEQLEFCFCPFSIFRIC